MPIRSPEIIPVDESLLIVSLEQITDGEKAEQGRRLVYRIAHNPR